LPPDTGASKSKQDSGSDKSNTNKEEKNEAEVMVQWVLAEDFTAVVDEYWANKGSTFQPFDSCHCVEKDEN